MADVKVPTLLHKMSKAAQKAWYKKNNMKMPDDMEGRSAAAAKKVKVTPRKEIAVEPGSVRALNAARQQAYMAKGGRQPIGAAGSGGHSSMAGSNMSTAKGMIAGIKAGFNPKVSLDPYESEKAKKVGPRSLKMKKEEVELDEANMRFDYEAAARPKSSDVKNFLNRNKNARAGAASKKYIRRMTKLGGLGPNQTKKDTEKHMKNYFEEVQISEASKEGKSVMYGMRASMKAMDLRHGVDSDKRDSGYKMSPAVRAAQAKSDALSKVEKPVQAGTLAALKRREMKKEEVEYIEEKLSAGDPASKWISDFVASDNPKFAGKTKKERINMALGAYYAAKKGKNEEVEHVEEAADPGKLRVVNKKVEAQASKDTKKSEQKSKATEKAIDVAKSKKNPVNLKPVLNGDKVNNA